VRALLTGERATIAAARVQHLCKVEVTDADGTYEDWSAYLMSATWGEHIDQPVAQATIKLRRAAGTSSLAPTMVGSPLNRNSLAAYAAALDVGRLVRISTATINPGDTPTYREMFSGRIDDIDWAADPIAITCSDLGAFLMDTQIEVERDYWSTDGTMVLSALTTGDHGTTLAVLVESVMGKLLADTPNGITSPALYTPASPGWRINPYKQDKVKVLEAVRALGQQIGWDVRYRYDASHASRLTFIDPSRSSTTVAATIAPTEYKDVKKLAIALADVRNAGLVAYLDTGSVRHEVTASDTASIAKYGRRYMQLEPGQNIDTDTEATAYITAAVSDLSGAPAEQDVELLYFWPVQLFDRYTFTANGDHYDTDQTLAVTAYSHTFEHGEGTTTLTCAGRVIGSFADWLKRQGPADTPASDPARSITRVVATETTDGTARNFVVTIGGEVDTVHVHYRTVPIAAIGDVFDFSGDEDTTVSPSLLILPRAAGSDTISFSLPHPSRGFKIAARMVPHTAPPGYFEGGNWPVQIDAAPPAVNAKIHPARVGAVASLSIDIAFGVSDGPVTVDVMEDTFTTSTTILTATMTAPATIDNITNAALGNRALPPGKDSLQWRVRITDVSGQAFWFGPASANRDPLANGTVTVVDYRANPSFVCAFDQDTDVITIRTHSGKVKTFNRAALDAAGSPVTWNATDATDDATSDPALTVDVVSTGYTVKYTGGGTDSLIWSGSLHGQPSNPPTADIRTDPNANRDAADVRIRPDTQVGEKLFVYYRDGSTNAALQWIACVSAGDPTALQVVAGTQLGPANFFRRVDGVGSPVAKLSAIPLARDQVLKNGAMIQGVDSGIQSPWLDVVLSVMEKPWNEAFDLAWDEATGNVVATVSAGAHVLFETVQIADNALFVSPTTQTVAIADGTTAKLTFALSQAQRGKTWYGRAKPNNNGSGTGLDGEYQYAVVPVPAVFTLQPSVAETTTQGTLTLVVSDPGSVLNAAWTNGTITTPIHFEVQRLGVKTIEAPTTLPGGGATTGTYTKVITLLDHPVTLLGFAHMIDGSVRAIGAWTFDSNKVYRGQQRDHGHRDRPLGYRRPRRRQLRALLAQWWHELHDGHGGFAAAHAIRCHPDGEQANGPGAGQERDRWRLGQCVRRRDRRLRVRGSELRCAPGGARDDDGRVLVVLERRGHAVDRRRHGEHAGREPDHRHTPGRRRRQAELQVLLHDRGADNHGLGRRAADRCGHRHAESHGHAGHADADDTALYVHVHYSEVWWHCANWLRDVHGMHDDDRWNDLRGRHDAGDHHRRRRDRESTHRRDRDAGQAQVRRRDRGRRNRVDCCRSDAADGRRDADGHGVGGFQRGLFVDLRGGEQCDAGAVAGEHLGLSRRRDRGLQRHAADWRTHLQRYQCRHADIRSDGLHHGGVLRRVREPALDRTLPRRVPELHGDENGQLFAGGVPSHVQLQLGRRTELHLGRVFAVQSGTRRRGIESPIPRARASGDSAGWRDIVVRDLRRHVERGNGRRELVQLFRHQGGRHPQLEQLHVYERRAVENRKPLADGGEWRIHPDGHELFWARSRQHRRRRPDLLR
jgi:hypothetical protein